MSPEMREKMLPPRFIQNSLILTITPLFPGFKQAKPSFSLLPIFYAAVNSIVTCRLDKLR